MANSSFGVDSGETFVDNAYVLNNKRQNRREDEYSSAPARVRLILAWLALSLIWGSTWFVIKVGLTDLPPLSFAVARFLVGSLLLFAVCLARGTPIRAPRWVDYGFLALTGILTFTINYGLLFWGEQRISSGLAAILQATIPGFGMLFAHFLIPSEPLCWSRLVGVLIGLLGVAAICSNMLSLEGATVLRAAVGLVVGAASTAFANVLIKSRRTQFDPAMMAAWQMLFGLIPLGLLAISTEGSPFSLHWTRTSFACLLYLAVVGSCVAFCLFYWLINRISVTNLQTIPLITPPLAVLLGWIAGGEKLSGFALLGSLFVLGGVALIVRVPARLPRPSPCDLERASLECAPVSVASLIATARK